MIDLSSIILLLSTGGIAGFVAGYFGAGGGLIIVPALIPILEGADVSSLMATHLAVGTGLLVAIGTSSLPAYRAFTGGRPTARVLTFICVAAALAAVGGSLIAAGLDGKTLRLILGLIALIPAFQLLAGGGTPKREKERVVSLPPLAGSGIFMGLASSLTGIEASIPGIPVMYKVMSIPLKDSVGSANAASFAAALAGTVLYIITGQGKPLFPPVTLGYVDVLAAFLLLVATIPMALWGASIARKSQPRKSRKLYGVVLLVLAVKMVLF